MPKIQVQYLFLHLGSRGPSPCFSLTLEFGTILQTMNAEKKEMAPATRDYTINLHKACHKVYVVCACFEVLK